MMTFHEECARERSAREHQSKRQNKFEGHSANDETLSQKHRVEHKFPFLWIVYLFKKGFCIFILDLNFTCIYLLIGRRHKVIRFMLIIKWAMIACLQNGRADYDNVQKEELGIVLIYKYRQVSFLPIYMMANDLLPYNVTNTSKNGI